MLRSKRRSLTAHTIGENLIIKSALSGDRLYISPQILNPSSSMGSISKSKEDLKEEGMDSTDHAEKASPMETDASQPLTPGELPNTRIIRNYSCSKCEFYTQNPRTHLYHHRDVHNDKAMIYECTQCLYASKHTQKLQRHIAMCHRNGGGEEVEVEDETKSSGTSDEFEAENAEEDVCQNTNEEDKQEEAAEVTEMEIPEKKSASKAAKKILKCDVCDFKATDRLRFRKHVKRHKKTSMIGCTLCDFRTPYKWNLDRHLKNHVVKGALQCPVCSFAADIKQSITVHIQNHHKSLSLQEIEGMIKNLLHKPEPPRTDSDDLPILVNENGELDSSRLNVVDAKDILEKNGKVYFKKLKCPKQNCDFKAVWETELNRHLSQAHSVHTQRKSMPKLKPVSPVTVSPNDEKSPPPNLLPRIPDFALSNVGEDFHETNLLQSMLQSGGKLPAGAKSYFEELKCAGTGPAIKKSNSNDEGNETSPGGKNPNKPSPTTPPNHQTKKYKCHQHNCNFWTFSMSHFRDHEQTHPFKNSFKCSKCDFRSNLSSDVVKHIRMVSGYDDAHLVAQVQISAGGPIVGKSSVAGAVGSKNAIPINSIGFGPLKSTKDVPRTSTSPNTENLNTSPPQEIPRMPTLIRAPTQMASSSQPQPGSSRQNGASSPPKLKQIAECRTFVEAKMLSGGQIQVGDQGHQGKSSAYSSLSNGSSDNVGGPPSLKRIKLDTEQPPEKTKTWKCKMCAFRHDNKGAVVNHIRQFHKKITMKLQSALPPMNPRISQDKKTKPVPRDPQNPMETHQYRYTDGIFSCKFCPFKTDAIRQMEVHADNHFSKPDNKFSCEFCSFSVRNQQALIEHVVLHGMNGYQALETVTTQQITPEETPPKPPGAGSSYKKYHCMECPYVTDSRGQFQYHKQFHVQKQESTFKCDHCSYNVTHKHLLHQHSRVHLQESGNSEGTVESIGNVIRQQFETAEVDSKHPTVLMWRDGQSFKVYRCRSCPQIFENLNELLRHENTHVESEDEESVQQGLMPVTKQNQKKSQDLPLSVCKFCPTRFFKANDLVTHASFHRIKSPFKCANCSYSGKNTEQLESHTKVHGIEYQMKTQELFQKINRIKCPVCPTRLPNEPSFLQHYGYHGRVTNYVCGICDFGADSSKNLILHKFIHNLSNRAGRSVMPGTIPIPKKLPPKIQPPVESIAPGRSIIRSRVDKPVDEAMIGNPNFSYPTFVKRGKAETREKRYKCQKCPSAFEKRDQYNVHMGLHGSDQRYKCTICDYSVTYYANFSQHLKKHESQPEVSKELLKQLATPMSKKCGAPAASTSGTILTCSGCPFSSIDQNEVDEHESYHGRTSPGLHPCQFCDFAAKDKSDLVRHTKYHFQGMKPAQHVYGSKRAQQGNGQSILVGWENENHEEEDEEEDNEDQNGDVTVTQLVNGVPGDFYDDCGEDQEEMEGEEEYLDE